MTNSVQRDQPRGISVLISGAGVGGLMAALECWRKGYDVRIFEKAKSNQTHGDGFTVGPSAIRTFRNWPNLQEREKEICDHPLVEFHNFQGERLRGPFELSELSKSKADLGRHHRPLFHAILLEQLSAIGLEVEYGQEVKDYFEDAYAKKAGVTLNDGSRHEADLVIAADGGRTVSWSLIAGHPVPARSSGDAIFRAAFPLDLAVANSAVDERFKLTEDGRSLIELWYGPDFNFTVWRNERNMQWALIYPDSGEAEESWGHRVNPQKVLDLTSTFHQWPKVADELIAVTPSDRLVDWKLMFRDPQPTWTSPAGHVVQIGDAAHTLLPTSGNGATQALEDAVSLGHCLSRVSSKGDIPNATRVHNLLRFERVSFLQAFGVVQAWKRNSKNRDVNDKSTDPSFGEWITEHDPEFYASDNYEAALKHIEHGTPFLNTNTPSGVPYAPWTIDSLREALENGKPTVFENI